MKCEFYQKSRLKCKPKFPALQEPFDVHPFSFRFAQTDYQMNFPMTTGGRRSRYEEFDLDEPLPTDDDANDDASFEELTLDTDPDATSTVRPVVTASTRQPFISTQNIYKITKSTKSKSLKRSSSGTAAVLAQPLLEIRLSKPTSQTFGTEKQFNDVNAFRYITELFDQYQWNADDVRDDISSRCASDLDTFIRALVDGKAWATKGKCSPVQNVNIFSLVLFRPALDDWMFISLRYRHFAITRGREK